MQSFRIVNNAVSDEEAKQMVKKFRKTPIYQKLKGHCKRQEKRLVVIFKKDRTEFKCV